MRKGPTVEMNRDNRVVSPRNAWGDNTPLVRYDCLATPNNDLRYLAPIPSVSANAFWDIKCLPIHLIITGVSVTDEYALYSQQATRSRNLLDRTGRGE